MEPTDHNRRAFDDAHRTAENVLATPGMPDAIRERLHGAKGSRVLHLLCGNGRESLELPWVHADVHALPPELLLGRWDLVYLGYGSLARLRDVNAWAAGVAAALRPGGVMLLHDEHPAGACLDAFGRWRDDYFARPVLGEVITAVTGAGLALRGLEEWPGKDPKVPGHLVLAAEKPEA